MTPKEYKQMMGYLTRSGIKDKIKFASDVAKPVDKFEVQQIKLFNEFNRRNPRTKKAGGGMLVQPGFGGVRQGYADDTLGEVPTKFTKDLLKKRISIGRATGPTSQAVTVGEIFETVKNVKGGPELISDFKKSPTEEKFLNLRKKYKNRVKTERIQNLSAQEKIKFRQKVIKAEKKWRASEKGRAYFNKLNATKGIFPAITPQERVWRDIYRAARQGKETSRFKIKYPRNIEINPETGLPKAIKSAKGNMYIPWHQYYKQISFYDTKTNSTIKFNNTREWMKNNVKNGGKKYDNAISNYVLRQSISDFNIGDESLGTIFKKSKIAEGASPTVVRLASPAAVNHISGLDNFWDTEVTTSTGNQQLNNKVQSKISAYKNAKNPLQKHKILKQMNTEINKIKGGATFAVDEKIIGKSPTTKKVIGALGKELNVKIPFKEFEKTLASFGDGSCPVTFGPKKRDGGRIGYQVGTIDKKRCIDQGVKNFNEGRFKTADQVQDAAKLLSGGRRVLSGLMKYGIIPELAFVGLEATGKSILGEKPLNAIKKSIDTFTFGLTDFTSGIEAEKFGKFGDLKLDVDKYRNSLAKVNSIQQDIANLETLNTGSQFGYEGDQTKAIQMKKAQLEVAKKELQQNMISPDKVSFIDRMSDNIADAQMAKSAYAEASAKDQMIGIPGVADYMDTETARVFPKQPSQVELNLNMLPSFQDYQKSDQGQIDRTILNAPDEVLQEISPDALDLKKALQEEYKMENLKNTFGAEQIYGTQGVFSQPLAGGGIAGLSGGKKSGPPPISGPTPDGEAGLPAAFKNVRKR